MMRIQTGTLRGSHATLQQVPLLGSAKGWFPTDIAGLVGWWDFSDATTLFTDAGSTPVSSDGDLIYQANDKSGEDNHLTQSTEADRPAYKVSIKNGLSVARFAQDHLDKSVTINKPFTHIGVIYPGSGMTTNNRILGSTTGGWQVHWQSTGGGQGLARFDWTYTLASSSGSIPISSWTIFLIQANSTSSFWRINGAADNSGTLSDANAIGVEIGASNGGYEAEDMDFAEYLIYEGAISLANCQSIETYLNNKWSIY